MSPFMIFSFIFLWIQYDKCDPAVDCINEPISCDDNVACTEDICDPVKGCTNLPNNNMCDDGSSCTSNVCSMTGCIYPRIECECSDWSDRSECKMDCDGWFKSRERTCDCSTECGISTVDTVPCNPEIACTYNSDYWKLHPNEVRKVLDSVGISSSNRFLHCDSLLQWDYFSTWYIDVKTYAWADFARETLTAKLNIFNGIVDEKLNRFIDEAEEYFSKKHWCQQQSVPKEIYYGLVYFNEGMEGPGNCDSPACCLSKIEESCKNGERTSIVIALCTKTELLDHWLANCAECGTSIEEC